MATIYKEFVVDAPVERVWDAVRDYGALTTRLVPGFVTDCRLDGDIRTVTFFNGMVARERLVGIDESRRRLAYTVIGGQAQHHHATVQILADQVFANGAGSRFVWITDVLPDAMAGPIGQMMDQGVTVIKKTLEKR